MSGVFHSLPYPSLEDGNLSYPEGTYEGVVRSLGDGTSVQVNHKLTNAEFIDRQIQRGRAQFGCLLAVRTTGYRKLFMSSNSTQKVDWNIDVVGEVPVIRPVIVATESFDHEFSSKDDVASIWIGKKVNIPKGARLARDTYLKSTSSMQSLLNILEGDETDNLEDGSFFVRAVDEQGYFFNVRVASNLYAFLQNTDREDPLYHNVAVHMISCCLVILREKFYSGGEDGEDWREYSNLVLLDELFRKWGIASWMAEDFYPERSASTLYPLILPSLPYEEEVD